MNKFIISILLIVGMTSCAKTYKEPAKGIDPRGITPLFYFLSSNSTCAPAENVNGKNFRPEAIMDKYPECFLESYRDAGAYILNCTSSKLATSYYYATTESQCTGFASTYKK